MSKYGNRKVTIDGVTFHSAAEAQRYTELKILTSAGSIRGLCLQPEFTLQDKFRDASGVLQRAIIYRADFSYYDCDLGRNVVEEVKGAETQVWLIKKKMFLKRYPGLELRVLKA